MPTRVDGLTGIIDVAVGYAHRCALDRGGNVYCWGKNSLGELGDPSREDSLVPKLVVF